MSAARSVVYAPSWSGDSVSFTFGRQFMAVYVGRGVEVFVDNGVAVRVDNGVEVESAGGGVCQGGAV